MSVPSLEDLLAELDRQDELDAIEEQPEVPDQAEVQAKSHPIDQIQQIQQPEQHDQPEHEQEGGSSASAAVRPRRGGRFSDLLGSSSVKPSAPMPAMSRDDGDASTRDDERSTGTGQVMQEHHSSSSEEAEGLSRVTELQQLDEVDPERQRAQVEAAAFEERQRKAKEEAEQQAKEDERRRVEAAREAWERHRMAAEEAEERRVRANRYASILEDKTRKMVEKQSSKRKKLREDERKQKQQEKDKQKEEKMRSEAARMSEKIRKMAENGYALGPSGWVRMDWLSNPAEIGDPNFQVVQGPMSKVEEDEPDEGSIASDGDNNLEVVDQRPLPDEEQKAPEARPFEDVLAELDKKQMESMASGAQAADLETVLDIVAADEERDMAAATAAEVRQGYEKLGEVEEEEDDVPKDATETATKVLRVARTRRPDAKFGEAINEESALKPFNDFMEEKQEGSNSYEERQARSAAIQAKLQAARNRMSIVRYERGSNSTSSASAAPAREQRSAPKPKPAKPQPKVPDRRDDRYHRPGQSGWGWLQSG